MGSATRRSAFAARLDSLGEVAVPTGTGFARRGTWRELFRDRVGPGFSDKVIFEIGCFNAEFLCRVARAHPDVGFVGLDWKCKAICDGAEQVASTGLQNVLLLHGRAADMPDLFAPAELDEIWVLHPDPCDKPKELPNRLFAPPFLVEAHAALGPQGLLTLKTDHPGYYQWALGLFGLPSPAWFNNGQRPPGSPKLRVRDLMPPDQIPAASDAALSRFDVAANSPDFWNDPAALAHAAARPFAGESTLFERRFLNHRQSIYYLELRSR